jgi:hypothetical protein
MSRQLVAQDGQTIQTKQKFWPKMEGIVGVAPEASVWMLAIPTVWRKVLWRLVTTWALGQQIG